MNRLDTAFFGCWNQAGHYLRDEKGTLIYNAHLVGLPKPEDLDGSHLFLPYPEVIGHGHLTYLPALDLSVMSWWNRVFDTRGKVNSHIMVRGHIESAGTMWRVFVNRYPEVARNHEVPIIKLPI